MTALVARPERIKEAGRRQETVATAHFRLMVVMLLVVSGGEKIAEAQTRPAGVDGDTVPLTVRGRTVAAPASALPKTPPAELTEEVAMTWARFNNSRTMSGLFLALRGIAIAHTDVLAGIGLPSTPSGSDITAILPGYLLALASL